MPGNKPSIGSNLGKVDATTDEDIARQIAEDPDTAPEFSPADLRRADHYDGQRLIKRGRGRPRLANPKQQVTLRLDRDVVEGMRSTGPGWQVRVNEALRRWVRRQREAS